MSHMPQLTVLMCLYNEERHMSQAIESLLVQTYSDFRFVIVNNGSTDGTASLAKSYADRDPRITVINLAENNPSYAHVAIAETETTYYMGCAGHDYYAPHFIEKCLALLEAEPEVVLAYPKAHWFKESGIGPVIPSIETRYMPPLARAMVVSYGLVEAYQGYGIFRVAPLKCLSKHKVVGFDHVMLTELAFFGSFAMVDEPLFFMRQADSFGDASVYRKKHLPNEPDGVGPFLKMTEAYMSLAERLNDPSERTLLKLSFFTMSLLRYPGILNMFGESRESLLQRPGFRELTAALAESVRFIEEDLYPRYAANGVTRQPQPEGGTPATGGGNRVKIAGEVASDHDLTEVNGESEFARAIRELFRAIKPKKVLETGTFLGEGTTRVIAETLRDLGLEGTTFCTIECNPQHYRQALANLAKRNLIGGVTTLYGLSVPRAVLPTIQEIEESCVRNIEFDDIFVDHQEVQRALLYYKETDFAGSPDDLLGKVLQGYRFRPDFVLLDSGGHMGNIEFNYLVGLLQGECYVALDDIYHIKHHKSFRQIQSDPRFSLVSHSREKFGFCIARFTPGPLAGSPVE